VKRIFLAFLGLFVVAVVTAGLIFWRQPIATAERVGRLGLRRAGLTRATIGGPRGPLVYWHGGAGPTVVLLHGANDSAAAWARVAGPLARTYYIVIPDLPGHGESAPESGSLSMRDELAGVEAILAEEGPAVLVGNSMGGWLALLYARAHPDRVHRVVVLNGAGLSAGVRPVNLLPGSREEARTALNALLGPEAPPVTDFVLDDLVRRSPGSPLARLHRAGFADLALDGRLGEIEVPVTLLWGEADQLLPLAYAEAMAAGLRRSRLVRVERCGHAPQRECPKRLLPLLEQALAGPPEGK